VTPGGVGGWGGGGLYVAALLATADVPEADHGVVTAAQQVALLEGAPRQPIPLRLVPCDGILSISLWTIVDPDVKTLLQDSCSNPGPPAGAFFFLGKIWI